MASLDAGCSQTIQLIDWAEANTAIRYTPINQPLLILGNRRLEDRSFENIAGGIQSFKDKAATIAVRRTIGINPRREKFCAPQSSVRKNMTNDMMIGYHTTSRFHTSR